MDPDLVFTDRRLKDAHRQYAWSWNYNFIDLAEMMYDAKF